jgi:hypothetical protein
VKFAIDFDGTFTADPSLFRRLVATIRNAGHEVRIVTMRNSDSRLDIVAMAGQHVDGIICTDGKPKRAAAAASGYRPHIWIDDMPETIGDAVILEASP